MEFFKIIIVTALFTLNSCCCTEGKNLDKKNIEVSPHLNIITDTLLEDTKRVFLNDTSTKNQTLDSKEQPLTSLDILEETTSDFKEDTRSENKAEKVVSKIQIPSTVSKGDNIKSKKQKKTGKKKSMTASKTIPIKKSKNQKKIGQISSKRSNIASNASKEKALKDSLINHLNDLNKRRYFLIKVDDIIKDTSFLQSQKIDSIRLLTQSEGFEYDQSLTLIQNINKKIWNINKRLNENKKIDSIQLSSEPKDSEYEKKLTLIQNMNYKVWETNRRLYLENEFMFDWYNSYMNKNKKRLNWGEKYIEKAPLEEWSGVEVNEKGHVVSLDLVGLEIHGYIHPNIENLEHLEDLFLSDNHLGGKLPESIGNLDKLINLYLDNNQFTGNLPESIYELNALRCLSLFNNRLEGEISTDIGKLKSLKFLYLDFNNFVGILPKELGDLPKIKIMFLNNNNFEGNLPSELSKLSKIKYLNISNNQLLTGLLPGFDFYKTNVKTDKTQVDISIIPDYLR